MFLIKGKLVSDEIFKEKFVCDLSACKGACCVEGDYGAPLEKEELDILEEIQSDLEPFLTEKGKTAIEKDGPYVEVELNQMATTLVKGRECAYMTRSDNGVAQCGIEQAYKAGAVNFQKPISCHLYPIRINKNEEVDFEALNYDRWDICAAACTLGKTLKVPVYKFLETPLIRKFGAEFFEALEAAAQENSKEKT